MKIRLECIFTFIFFIGLNSSCSIVMPAFSLITSTNRNPSTTVSQELPTPASPNIPTPDVDLFCWPLKPLEKGNINNKSLIYQYHSENETTFFTYNLNSLDFKKFEMTDDIDDGLLSMSFGGDKILSLTNNNLVFISQKDIQYIQLPNEMKGLFDRLFFENEYPRVDGKVILSKSDNSLDLNKNYKKGLGLTYTYYLFDPVTNSIFSNKIFLPDYYLGERGVQVLFSPDMKYVLYRAINTKEIIDRFVVYDIEKEEIILNIPPINSNLGVTVSEPHWLPDENKISAVLYNKITGSRNYYLISIDGEISTVYEMPLQLDISSYYLKNPLLDWSWNKRYLVSGRYDNLIYIWDNQVGTLYRPCLPNETDSIERIEQVWSPDSNYLIVTLRFLPLGTQYVVEPSSGRVYDERIYKKYILDLVNKIIYEVPLDIYDNDYRHYYFMGWANWY